MSTDTHTCGFVFAMMQLAGANVKEKEVSVELPPDATFSFSQIHFSLSQSKAYLQISTVLLMMPFFPIPFSASKSTIL